MAQIEVKEVNVKQISGASVAQLRANKEGRGGGASRAADTGSRAGYSGATVGPVLDECVRTVLASHPIMSEFEMDSSKSLISAFVTNVTSRGQSVCPEALAAAVFQEASTQAGQLAAICLNSDNEFWELTMTCHSILVNCDEGSPVFASATQALVDLGKQMVVQDSATTEEFFDNNALQNLSDLISSSPGKRHDALRILYAFCAQDVNSHVKAIKQLQSKFQNGESEMETFIHSLTILIFMERQMNETLLDLYLYYCVIGTTDRYPPSLRAASVAMLSVVVANNVSLVLDMLPSLKALTEEEYFQAEESWEMHAQLLVVCSAILRQLSPESEHAFDVIFIVKAILNPDASLNVRKIGLSYLAKNVETHRDLLPTYLSCLTNLPKDLSVKKFVLSTAHSDAEEIAVAGASGGRYRLAPLPLSPGWSGLSVAQQLVEDVQEEQPDHLEVEQMQALLACLTTHPNNTDSVFEANMPAWQEVFNQARDYVFVALCDAECCDLALCILREFVTRSALQEKVLQEGNLLGSLRLLYPLEPGADQGCQTKVADFLEEMYAAGNPYSSAVVQLLENFALNHMDQFEKSPLRDLREKISQQS